MDAVETQIYMKLHSQQTFFYIVVQVDCFHQLIYKAYNNIELSMVFGSYIVPVD